MTALVHAEGVTRVARVFSASCPSPVIDRELAVHDAIRTSTGALREHAISADDLVTLPDGRLALLVEQVGGPSLDALLAERRGALALGEAVTLLAPIVQALEAAHAAGVVGLAPTVRSVRLGSSGAPIIVRVQDALAGPPLPERFRALEPAYAADAAMLERFGAAVAAAVPERDRPGLLAALRAPALGRPLTPALFDLAAPQPVRTVSLDDTDAHDAALESGALEQRSASSTSRSAAPLSAPGEGDHAAGVLGAEPGVVGGPLPRWCASIIDTLRVIGLPESLVESVQSVAERLRVPRGNGGSSLRPRFMLAGAGGGLALVTAVLLASGAAEESEATAPEPVATTRPALDPGAAPGGAMGAAAQAGAESDAPESLVHPETDEWQALVGTLVDRWLSCRASQSADEDGAGCGARATHSGSAAERLIVVDDPRHAVLERWSALRGDAVVVERMGGAVLVDLVAGGTTTASLLVVRSEAGWRIRDVIG